MADADTQGDATLALDTKLEREFVQPLTAVRGALEILRDYPEMEDDERRRFLAVALNGCSKLEVGVTQLSHAVYDAAAHADAKADSADQAAASGVGATLPDRVTLLDEDTIEIDFSDVTFRGSEDVAAFFDPLDKFIESRNRSWYFIVNLRNNKIWPEAWVSHAHRMKKITVSYARAMIRFDESGAGAHMDPEIYRGRDDAIAIVNRMKSSA